MGRLEDYYHTQAGLQQKQQPAGSIVMPTLDTTNPLGSLVELLGPTPAEREAQERRMLQNRAKMQAWTGLFDGLRQLGNLYYATKGATPQTYANPYNQVDQEMQQQRQLRDSMVNYKRQYATSLYNLQRQMNEDKRKDKLADAQQSWYETRAEIAAKDAEIKAQKAEIDRLQKEAGIRRTDAQTQQINALTPLKEKEAQSRIDKNNRTGGGGRGRSNGTYGYRTTKHVDPATGDVITERVPTTGSNPDNKGRYDKYKKNAQSSSQSTSKKWEKYKKN